MVPSGAGPGWSSPLRQRSKVASLGKGVRIGKAQRDYVLVIKMTTVTGLPFAVVEIIGAPDNAYQGTLRLLRCIRGEARPGPARLSHDSLSKGGRIWVLGVVYALLEESDEIGGIDRHTMWEWGRLLLQ